MDPEIIQLVERVCRRLRDKGSVCEIIGKVSEAEIAAAEDALDVTFPPSYRKFLRTFGGLEIPSHLAGVHRFIGLKPAPAEGAVRDDVVGYTLAARAERRLGDHLVVVGMGAQQDEQNHEWFCLDVNRQLADGECPVLLYDAKENALDQEFYKTFQNMLVEVMTFVADSLDQPLD